MSKLKLQHWFAIWVIAMAVLVIFTQPDHRPDKLETVAFDTTSSSELYFKNVRSFYYRQDEEAEGILLAYRLKSLFGDDAEPSLPFVIYHNWRTQEAFIRLDTNYVGADPNTGLLVFEDGQSVDTLYFPEADHVSQYAFARSVYRALDGDLGIEKYSVSDARKALSGTERASTKRALTDYFKLLDKL